MESVVVWGTEQSYYQTVRRIIKAHTAVSERRCSCGREYVGSGREATERTDSGREGQGERRKEERRCFVERLIQRYTGRMVERIYEAFSTSSEGTKSTRCLFLSIFSLNPS